MTDCAYVQRPRIYVAAFLAALTDAYQREAFLIELVTLAMGKTRREWT